MRTLRFWLPLIIAAGCGQWAAAQPNQWPAALTIPETPEPADTHSVTITTKQSWYENSFNSKDQINFSRRDSLHIFQQNADYELSIDTGLGKQNEYLSLYGSYQRQQWPLKSTAVGLDWRPTMLLNSGRLGSALMGIGEIGPVVDAKVLDVPLRIRSGFVGIGWNDSLPDRLTDAHWRPTIRTSQSDLGLYGAFDLGEAYRPAAGLPLYLHYSGYGRVTDTTSRLVTTTGSLLYSLGLSSEDSIFLYYGDSISSGREGFLADMNFVNANPKTARSLQATAGMKGKKRFFITPAMLYNFSYFSINYPDWLKLYNDKRNTTNSVQIMGVIDTFLVFSYSGGMRWDWEREDKLYRAKHIGNVVTGYNQDSLSANLRDYDGFRIAMTHELKREWESGAWMNYVFDISRYSKTFPHYFLSSIGGDTIRTNEDNHWVVMQHRLEMEPVVKEKITLNLHGSISKNTSIYLKKERSGENATDRCYTVGAGLRLQPTEKLEFNELVAGVAKKTDFAFPIAHQDRNLDGRPDGEAPMSRSFSSKLKAMWQLTDRFSIKGEWDEEYWDEGYWNGKQYFDSIPPGFREVYAIDRKSLEWTVIMSTTYGIPQILSAETGIECGDIYFRVYKGKDAGYVPDDLGVGIILAPFLKCKLNLKDKLKLQAKLKYTDFNIFNAKLTTKTPRKSMLELDIGISGGI